MKIDTEKVTFLRDRRHIHASTYNFGESVPSRIVPFITIDIVLAITYPAMVVGKV